MEHTVGLSNKQAQKLLVPGDVIILEEGDKIPADSALLESLHLEMNEASLTGESMPVEKSVHEEEKKHIFLGTIVARGRAKALITSTGMQTRFGQIADPPRTGKNIFVDRIFILAFFGPLMLQPLLIYIPLLSGIFKITHVSLVQLALISALSAMLLVSSKIRKAVFLGRKALV